VTHIDAVRSPAYHPFMRWALLLLALVGCAGNRLVDLAANEAAKLGALCILIGLAGCGGGTGGDAGGQRLADLSGSDATALCDMTQFSVSDLCPSMGTGCVFLNTTATCTALIDELPDSCAATPADLAECSHVSCSDYMHRCAAFTACGITVWMPERGGCP
jgi:hypothetical protein